MRLQRTLAILTLAVQGITAANDNGPKLRASTSSSASSSSSSSANNNQQPTRAVEVAPSGPVNNNNPPMIADLPPAMDIAHPRLAALSLLDSSLLTSEASKLAELGAEAPITDLLDDGDDEADKAKADAERSLLTPAQVQMAQVAADAMARTGLTPGNGQQGRSGGNTLDDLYLLASRAAQAGKSRIQERADGTGGPLEAAIYGGIAGGQSGARTGSLDNPVAAAAASWQQYQDRGGNRALLQQQKQQQQQQQASSSDFQRAAGLAKQGATAYVEHLSSRAQGGGGPIESFIVDRIRDQDGNDGGFINNGNSRPSLASNLPFDGALPAQMVNGLANSQAAQKLPLNGAVLQGLAGGATAGVGQDLSREQQQKLKKATNTFHNAASMASNNLQDRFNGNGGPIQDAATSLAKASGGVQGLAKMAGGYNTQRGLGAVEHLAHLAGTSGGAQQVLNGLKGGDVVSDGSLAEELAQAIAIMKLHQREEAQQQQQGGDSNGRRGLGAVEHVAHLAGTSGGAHHVMDGLKDGDVYDADGSLATDLAQAIAIMKQRQRDQQQQQEQGVVGGGGRNLGAVEHLAHLAGTSGGAQQVLNGLKGGDIYDADGSLVTDLAQAIAIMKQRQRDQEEHGGGGDGRGRNLEGVWDGTLAQDLAQAIAIMRQRERDQKERLQGEGGGSRRLATMEGLAHLAATSSGTQRVIQGLKDGDIYDADGSLATDLAQAIAIMKQRQRDQQQEQLGQQGAGGRNLGAVEHLAHLAGTSGGAQQLLNGLKGGDVVSDGSLAEELAQAIAIMKLHQREEAQQRQADSNGNGNGRRGLGAAGPGTGNLAAAAHLANGFRGGTAMVDDTTLPEDLADAVTARREQKQPANLAEELARASKKKEEEERRGHKPQNLAEELTYAVQHQKEQDRMHHHQQQHEQQKQQQTSARGLSGLAK